MRSKKTLTNQLNVEGSSDNRRLDNDISPTVFSNWTSVPGTAAGTVALGSSVNRWNQLYTDFLYAYGPKIPLIWEVSGATVPSGNPATNYQGIQWYMRNGGTPASRLCYYWNGSSWVLDTPIVGQMFMTFNATPDRKMYAFSGVNYVAGTGGGWARNGTVNFLA